MWVPERDEERGLGAGLAPERVVHRGQGVRGQKGVERERLVGGPCAQEGTAAELQCARVEVTPDGIICGTRREAKGLDESREASGTHALLCRRKAESERSSLGGKPTDVLADQCLIGGPTVLKTEDSLEARSSPRINSFD